MASNKPQTDHEWAAAKLAWLLACIARDFEAAAAALRGKQ